MGSLVRLLVLALVVSAVVGLAQGDRREGKRRGGGRRRGGRPQTERERQLALMAENGCLPEDFSAPHFSSCEKGNQENPSQRLRCIASSTGIAGKSGYDATAAEAFVDKHSSNQTWRARQKEHLQRCSALLDEDLAAQKQGIFMLACWHRLKVVDCDKQRLVAAAVAVDAEKGGKFAEGVAKLAEGSCLDRHIKYSENVTELWNTCDTANNLNMSVLSDAAFYYMKLSFGVSNLPELSSDYIATVANELNKVHAAAECYASASKEVSSDGTINYDKMTEKIDNSEAVPRFKEAAKKLLEHCQSKEPQNIGEFHDCYLESQPYGCAALYSHRIAGGRRGPGGRGRGRGRGRGGRGGRRGGGRGRGGRRRQG